MLDRLRDSGPPGPPNRLGGLTNVLTRVSPGPRLRQVPSDAPGQETGWGPRCFPSLVS